MEVDAKSQCRDRSRHSSSSLTYYLLLSCEAALSFSHCTGRWACVLLLLLLWKGHCGSNRPISALSSYVPYRTPSNIYIRKRMTKLTILGRRHRRHNGRHLAIPARHPQNSPTILRRLLGIRRLSRRLQWSGLGSSGLRARSCFVLHELRGDKEISCPIQAECFE